MFILAATVSAARADDSIKPIMLPDGTSAELVVIHDFDDQVIVVTGDGNLVAGTPMSSRLATSCREDSLASCEVYDFERQVIYHFDSGILHPFDNVRSIELYASPGYATRYSERRARIGEILRFESMMIAVLALILILAWLLLFSAVNSHPGTSRQEMIAAIVLRVLKIAAACAVASVALLLRASGPVSAAGLILAASLSGAATLLGWTIVGRLNSAWSARLNPPPT
jgi:hypothetical protein